MEDLFIDIGAKDQAAAEALVSIGEVAVFHAPLRIQGSLAVGGALDDRLGCALVLEALRQPCPHDLYGVFTVQEEVGTRGAGPAAYGIQPDLAIALDVTPPGIGRKRLPAPSPWARARPLSSWTGPWWCPSRYGSGWPRPPRPPASPSNGRCSRRGGRIPASFPAPLQALPPDVSPSPAGMCIPPWKPLTFLTPKGRAFG